jgi:hypothetical protein
VKQAALEGTKIRGRSNFNNPRSDVKLTANRLGELDYIHGKAKVGGA